MPNRRRKLEHIDVVAKHDVLKDRTVGDDLVRNDPRMFEIRGPVRVAHFPFAQMLRQPERHRAALAGEHIHQQAKALRAAGNVLEDDARTVIRAHDGLRRKAHIFFRVGAGNRTHFAETIGGRKPLTQIGVRNVGGGVGMVCHRFLFSRSDSVGAGGDHHAGGEGCFQRTVTGSNVDQGLDFGRP